MNITNGTKKAKIGWLHIVVNDTILWLFAVILTLGMTLILSFNLVFPTGLALQVGQPALEDIFAPRSINYVSDVLTKQKEEQASASVSDVYTPLDLSIGRSQLAEALAMFAFIETVRADAQATTETKLNYLSQIEIVSIEEQVALDLLEMSDANYSVAKADILDIIDVMMRQEIRESQLSDFRRIARREASLNLTQRQNNVVTNLAPQFVVPTVFPDEAATTGLREEAVASVEPVSRTISQGQRIVRAGDLVTEVDLETLEELGLLQPESNWQLVLSIFIISLVAITFITLYWQQYHLSLKDSLRYLLALGFIMLLFTLVARIMVSGQPLLVYWFPIIAMSMMLTVIFDKRFALLVTVVMAGLIGYINASSLEVALYVAAGGLLSILTLRDVYAQRINAFFRAGLLATVGHVAVVTIFSLLTQAELPELVELMLIALGNGLLGAALTLVGFFLMGSIFGVTTSLQLQDLSRLDHPLLQELLRKAPGTYHHSIMVANLAEQAAERIKANSTLVRVGAFYHDIGKMKRPPFFTENQEGINPHDSLDPYSSARIIISHVTDGLALADQYHLPDRIRDFIAEHHSERIVKGFYMKALDQVDGDKAQVERSKFKYPGPRPRCRESGIVMLADAIDATATALRPNSVKAIEKLVNSIVDEDLTDGQLDDSGLTLGDVKQLRASFIDTLKGRFHVRVKYPGNEEMMMDEETPLPVSPRVAQPPEPLPQSQEADVVDVVP